MLSSKQKSIVATNLFRKFCVYGFLKNMKLFEPFLMLYLLSIPLRLSEIGWLYAVREITVIVFSLPMGLLADVWGRKRTLMASFVFYMAFCLCLFMAASAPLIWLGMFLFGFAESLRLGTHKAMIFSWIAKEKLKRERTFVYARTRSYSMWGMSVGGLISAFYLIFVPYMQWVFLLAMIPYALDFWLVSTYPDELNSGKGIVHLDQMRKHLEQSINDLLQEFMLKRSLFSLYVYEGFFRTIRDYMQPLIQGLMISSVSLAGLVYVHDTQSSPWVLGVLYSIFYLLSAFATRQSYLCKKNWGARVTANRIFFLCGFVLLLISWSVHNLYLLIFLFMLFFVMSNMRRPLMVGILGKRMDDEKRATLFSLGSLIKSMVIVLLAPLLGIMADTLGMIFMLRVAAVLVLIMAVILRIPSKKSNFL